MSGIYIPTNIFGKSRTFLIFEDGRALDVHTGERFMAIHVPDHGDLKDSEELVKVIAEGIFPNEKDGGFKSPFDIIRAIGNAQTIIPASKEAK